MIIRRPRAKPEMGAGVVHCQAVFVTVQMEVELVPESIIESMFFAVIHPSKRMMGQQDPKICVCTLVNEFVDLAAPEE
jgi:hypothetical protein